MHFLDSISLHGALPALHHVADDARGLVVFQIAEVPCVLKLQGFGLALDDGVGIAGNDRIFSLPVYGLQSGHGHFSAVDKIGKDRSRPHTGELIHISYPQ